MKQLLVVLVFVFGMTAVNAQEAAKKDTYIQKGELIEAKLYFDTGELSQTGYFTKTGKVTGEWISYNREGRKTAVAQYNEGIKVGKWFFWNDDTLTEVDYDNSQIAAVNVWKNEASRVVSNK